MKRNMFYWMLMAAVVLGLSFSVTSCKDNDDDGDDKSGQSADADPLDTDEARTAFRWLCALSDADNFDKNWKSKTWEPTVGLASDNNQFTRIVVVNDLADAQMSFSRLAAKDPSELGAKLTVAGGAAGTMTWEVSPAGSQNLAVVTVNSRILPHLQKIVYCTEAQTGQNGMFFNDMEGVAYYRFGDVICDGDGYYWVCVRPSFAPANGECKSKGDSHWINIFNAAESGGKHPFPSANIKDTWNNLAKYNNQTIKLPTSLKYDREHIFNLSQLVWALINPKAYDEVCLNNASKTSALGGFPYTYHGHNFLVDVSNMWDEPIYDGYTIWQILFNHTREEMKKMKELHFYYMGYSWKFGNTGHVWSYNSKGYQSSYSGDEDDDEEAVDYVKDGFDVNYYAQADVTQKHLPRFETDGDGKHIGRWVVRYSLGEKLMTAGKYDYWGPITSKDGKMRDVYRYNEKKNVTVGSNIKPETDVDGSFKPYGISKWHAEAGDVIGIDGRFYDHTDDAKNVTGQDPVAVVIFNSRDTIVEKDSQYHGLAMGLVAIKDMAFGGKGEDCSVSEVKTVVGIPSALNGISVTKNLKEGCSKGHNHPLALACATYSALPAAKRTEAGFSDWFIPSSGQWKLALEGLGLKWDNAKGFTNSGQYSAIIYEKFKVAGQEQFWSENSIYNGVTSTAYNKDSLISATFSFILTPQGAPATTAKDKSIRKSFPFIAF